MLFLDLDRLKDVNDNLGHAAGDDVLRAAADHLRGTLRPGDVLARLGGDEFVASLLAPITDAEIGHLTARVHAALAEPLLVEGAELRIGASIGVVVADHHDSRDPEQVLRAADTAMYAAKNTGRGTTRYVSPTPEPCRWPATNRSPRHLINADPGAPGLREITDRPHSPDTLQHGVIYQAIGIIRSRSGGTAEEALAELTDMSHTHEVDLEPMAHRFVEDAVRQARTAAAPIP